MLASHLAHCHAQQGISCRCCIDASSCCCSGEEALLPAEAASAAAHCATAGADLLLIARCNTKPAAI